MRKFNLFKGYKAIMALAFVAMGVALTSCEKEEFDIKPGYTIGQPVINVTPAPTPTDPTKPQVDKAILVLNVKVYESMLTRAANYGKDLTDQATLLYQPVYSGDGSIPAQLLKVIVKVKGYKDAEIVVNVPDVPVGYTCSIPVTVEVVPDTPDDPGHDVEHGHDSDHGHGTGNAGGGTSK